MTDFSMSVSNSKRLLIKGCFAACLLGISRVGLAATQMVAVRLWPSSLYTRITLESNTSLEYTPIQTLYDPYRIYLDIKNLTLNNTFKSISTLVQSTDPFIKSVNVAQNTPSTVRLVIHLKQKVNPEILILKPISEFNHRFVIDLYPEANDPLAAFLERAISGDQYAPTLPYVPSSQKSDKMIVVLDPGHGGEDPGAIGYNKTKEKDVVLQIAKRTRDLLKKEKNIIVYMTREEDIFLPLSYRIKKARSLHADLFISIHADAFTRQSAKGSSVYKSSGNNLASSSGARYLAQTQNEADIIGGMSSRGDKTLDNTLLKMFQDTTLKNNSLLAEAVLAQMKKINTMHKNSVEQAGFYVLKAPDVPSILVETAFISNKEEEKKLKTATFQNKIANALLLGIKAYDKVRLK